MSRSLICSEMVQRIPKFDPFALDKDSPFALGILWNLTNGLEILSVKEEGFVVALATSYLESVFTERWFSCSAIVLMPYLLATSTTRIFLMFVWKQFTKLVHLASNMPFQSKFMKKSWFYNIHYKLFLCSNLKLFWYI